MNSNAIKNIKLAYLGFLTVALIITLTSRGFLAAIGA